MKLGAIKATNEIVDQFKGFDLFTSLEKSEIDDFIENSSFHSYKKNANFIIEGDPIDHLYIVMSGWVKLNKNTQDGKSVILQMVGAGGFFGEIAQNPKYAALYGAQVVSSEAVVVKVSKAYVSKVIKSNGMFAYQIIRYYSDSVVDLQRKIEKLEMMNVEERVYAHLCDLLAGKTSTVLPYSKKIMANQLGMKPETFSRALRKLEKEGIAISGNIIYLKNDRKLAS